MTREQCDYAINKAHDILDNDSVVTVKCTFSKTELFTKAGLFMNERAGHVFSVFYGCAYIIFIVSKMEDYDAHEALGYVLSEMIYIGASKIKSI